MRTTIRLALSLMLLLVGTAWSGSALADVFAFADIYKDKNVTETINIDITKTITVNVTYTETVIGDAEAHTLVNQVNAYNYVDGKDDLEPGDLGYDIELDATIGAGADANDVPIGSISSNTGVIGVNQDVGNMVNQANAVTLAETISTSSITESQAHGEQNNYYNESYQTEVLTWAKDGITGDGEVVDGEPLDAGDLAFAAENPGRLDPDKTALIENSINQNSGIVGVNQNSGNNNNQANGVAIAVGFGSHVALAEADLGQYNAWNTLFAFETLHVNTISNSINDNSGTVTVNQTSGSNNNQGSMISLSALTTDINVTTTGH
jgi:hypothetical protein